MTASTIAIETRDLTKRFEDTRVGTSARSPIGSSEPTALTAPRNDGGITAVNRLSLRVEIGEVFGFLGHNGAGKTTTVRLLNGVLSPTAGNVRVLGLNPMTDGPGVRRQSGVLTESPSMDDRLTATETLTLYGKLYGVPPADLGRRVPELLEEFGLEDRAHEYVGGYSKGMRQRLALARTLIHQPRLLFLDEPTSGLDPVGRRSVHELIISLSHREEHTTFLCTHDLVEAQRLCDRVGVMEQGRLVALGTPEELARDLQHGVRLDIALESALPEGILETEAAPDGAQQVGWDDTAHVATIWLPTPKTIPDLVALLVNTGARIYRVSPQEPTLEDVYFALHDRSTRQPARGGDR
ncbi:MAG: ABC transporter ATP-binding protein [Anaerolineae bacterium]